MENPTSNICNKIHTQKLKCICDLLKPKLLYCKQWHSFKQPNNIHAYYLGEIPTVLAEAPNRPERGDPPLTKLCVVRGT